MRYMRDRILYPFLFAAYPVLALLAYNIEEIKAQDALRSLIVSILVVWIFYFLLSRLLKNPSKAALITTFALVVFFSYGQVYSLLKPTAWLEVEFGRHRVLLPLWIVIFTAGVVIILRYKGSYSSLNRALNLISVILLVFPLGQLGLFALRSMTVNTGEKLSIAVESGLQLPSDQPPPDIYYIILDAYARDDVLSKQFKLDIEPFLQELEKIGFSIARCSQSNYAQTRLSLASSLNMDYLPELGDDYKAGNTSRVGITELVRHGAVRQALEELGYTSVAFETGFKGTQWEDANVYLSPSEGALGSIHLFGGLTSFEEMLIRTSAGLVLLDSKSTTPGALQSNLNNPNRIHYDLIRFDLEELRNMPERPGPKLVFAHLVIPHPPYVFEPDGTYVGYDKPDNPGYQDQIVFLNRELIPILMQIIAESSAPPIIVIQADHGAILAPPKNRMNILNAYHLPGISSGTIPVNISPVNTFRLIFNQYFNGNYDYLEDTAYFSVYNRPYEFVEIPNNREGCP
jgi:hypothetical protein